MLKRQRRISDDPQGSNTKLEENELRVTSLLEDETVVGRTSSSCSDTRPGVDYFQSFEEDEPTEVRVNIEGSSTHKSQASSKKINMDHGDDTLKKVILNMIFI